MYEEGDDFSVREYRRGVWHQTATTVALVTAAAGDAVNVMACEWAMMVSNNPLCFVIAVSPSHATHELIVAAGEFGLSFCSDQQALLSHVSGSFSLHDVDKWGLAPFPTYPAKKIGAPMIEGCTLNVECRVIARHDLGHTVFIGQALWARFDPDKQPLIYHDAKYWHLGLRVAKEE
jgi:flavin reductase (DIM6/NTAB) family NADH-FMN oxidoreductase RutF